MSAIIARSGAGLRALAFVTAALALTGCDQRQAPPVPAPAQPPEQTAETSANEYQTPAFVGQAWISTTRGHAPGTLRIFMADRTVLMDSCYETYRIENWGMVADDRIRWVEETIPIEARFEQPTRDALTLSIVGRSQVETYVKASVPYVCPQRAR